MCLSPQTRAALYTRLSSLIRCFALSLERLRYIGAIFEEGVMDDAVSTIVLPLLLLHLGFDLPLPSVQFL